MATVLDYSAKPIPARLIRDAGHLGAVRYISPPRVTCYNGMYKTAPEVRQHHREPDHNDTLRT